MGCYSRPHFRCLALPERRSRERRPTPWPALRLERFYVSWAYSFSFDFDTSPQPGPVDRTEPNRRPPNPNKRATRYRSRQPSRPVSARRADGFAPPPYSEFALIESSSPAFLSPDPLTTV